ncbi:bifunctional pyr operon transcriptional regulator/uracil phosphoribosyltransferase PyrR [Ectothiorhodospira lacustris]|uniref:bifunctional pyr operon transcriptional regulator/uracil phosphoribosyltransferase PyrR n=1 Tax=Ectothiorhodospira lacustris TaxID=2899127 RepID=UPI001EE7CCA1|nr:bifunctional pyr operon transcriptional regulator/uracil phosphoribosyltransferase PyrR [Ectothiorhodospira lacustris]MCG5500124.1 bifunctional pyr operon transcriptional regulator/uracil phosphoribosyltransferase PyrR [Ectothiorhodospira lacustris]MCG5510791.1 bifunctional pyr operon transcriptional regulator/uracil phosphoribosyltransferase PyrR [Ectothiorhodospira lacustris]MCG5522523.1 bifunctional pyr operon transcriptional regulator/uracil phosphoribosyltransferase PyrR [Ectothiorhodosp
MTEPVSTLLDRMAEALRRHLSEQHIKDPALVGIHTGGVWVAEQLHRRLGLNEPLGKLDISFYRDDFSRMGMHPQVRPSSLPFAVDERHILLVDDVLFTGRTIRAAMNELFDYGRPASVMLAVLVERDGRELPVQAQVVGRHLKLRADEQVKLRGPDPLRLDIVKLEPAS